MIRLRAVLLVIAGLLCLTDTFPLASAHQVKRPFNIADEIGLTLFGDPNGTAPEVHFSPDGNYVAVWAERGDLKLNLVEDSLRFYRREHIENFLKSLDASQPPAPMWIVNRSGREGRIINEWRWLHDSGGVAFLEGRGRDKRLMLADIRQSTLDALTAGTESVDTFDITDRRHYVYIAHTLDHASKKEDEQQAAAIVGTGRSLYELIFPEDRVYRALSDRHDKCLWAVIDGNRFEVKVNGVLLIPEGDLALSPDGQFLVTQLSVPEVPASWERLYPPPYPSSPYNHVHAGSKDARQYVLIDLRAGLVRALTDAPVSDSAGWWVYGAKPTWSRDSQGVLLPGTFVRSEENAPSRPCVAVVDLPSLTCTCVEILKGHSQDGGHEEGYRGIHGAHFEGGDKQRITVTFHNGGDLSSLATSEYQRVSDGTWQIVGQSQGEHETERKDLAVTVEQAYDKPPLLVGSDKKTARVIWDPNPQLKDIDLGQASSYKWKDREGHQWSAGLFKPSNYKLGQRYPLVIQTHGFAEFEFRPSGAFPTALAARALAAAGIIVLQLGDTCPSQTLEEARCVASGYEVAANQLVSDGLVDPERIGIIGFSRTDFYVMETLVFGSLHIKAASIADGITGGYLEYLLVMDGLSSEYDLMIGTPPFGQGLQQWLRRAPGFNLDKVTAPLLIVGNGPFSVLTMWEPYAALRFLKKPVDLMMLDTREHVLTNPAVRMASQGGSVDWFRFWLQDYEDADPEKSEQYVRWRKLRKMQPENEKKSIALRSN